MQQDVQEYQIFMNLGIQWHPRIANPDLKHDFIDVEYTWVNTHYWGIHHTIFELIFIQLYDSLT